MHSIRIRPYLLVLALLAAVPASTPVALAEEPISPAAAPAGEMADKASPSPFIQDYLSEVDRVRQQIASLAEAVPQQKYTWRPSDEVRSVSEVYLHIAFGNYMLPQVAGYEVPADVANRLGVDKLHTWDTSTTDKKAIAETMARSFDHLRSTVAGISDSDLDAKVDFFGQTPTRRQVLLVALGHLHEHLGQSIAYARMNGIVPPWSRAQQEAQAEAAEKAKEKKQAHETP